MSQRLKTDELFPSYRESYELHSLSQQLSQLQSTIQVKDKQIFYLTSQLVSIKEQNINKIMHLQNIISQNKKQLTQLRYLGLKNKRIQSDRGDKALQKLKHNYQIQIIQQKQSYQSIIEKLTIHNKKQVQNVQQKLMSVLSIEKKQQQSLKNLLQQKKINNDELILNFKAQIQKLNNQKQQLRKQIHRYSDNIQILKQDFKSYGDKVKNKQKQYKIQIQKLKSTQLSLKQTIISLEKQIKKSNQNINKNMYKCQLQKMKLLILQKDKQLAKISQTNNTKYISKNQVSFNPVMQCNHLGLIQQLQRNLRIKNQQIQELSNKLQYWSRFIGLQKNLQEKNNDLQTAASNAIIAQMKFVNNLKKRNKY